VASLDPKKILLVEPLGYSSDKAARDIARLASIVPPNGILSIAAYLERHGYRVEVVDGFAEPHADDRIRQYLLAERPATIGFSCITSNFLDGVRMATMAKDVLPGIRVLVGGAHGSALREKVLEAFSVIDVVVVGEGERTVLEYVEAEGENLSAIEGLVYREADGAVIFTGRREDPIDLDTLPFPAYEKLKNFPHAYKLPIFNYPTTPHSSCIASRGCPYACSYCDRSVFGKSFRYNSAEYMYEHLRYLKDRYGLKHILFYDDQFTFNRRRVVDFCTMMIDRPLGMGFNCVVRAEHVDRELLTLMKKAGCWMISMGIETGDKELLAQHRKNPDLDMLASRVRMIRDAGIRVKGLLMMGLPGETEASIRRSMDYVFSLPLNDFNVTKFTPFPGAPLYERIHELGEFNEDWERMDCMNFLFVTRGMTRERLEQLFAEFYRRHYSRPKTLLGIAAMSWKSPDSMRRLFMNLGRFAKFALDNRRLERLEA